MQWIRVNGTMYGKFSVGYKIIPEKATGYSSDFRQTPVEDEYRPIYENTLPGITDIATPMSKSTPVTQASANTCVNKCSLYLREIWWSQY